MTQKHDEWYFTGDGATYGTFDNDDAVELDSVNPPFTTRLNLAGGHGLKDPSLIYIQGTVNYNGIREIARDSAIHLEIYAKYVAELLAGTETWKTMISYDEVINGVVVPSSPFEFMGFELSLDAACATSENLTVTLDAARGSAWDNLIYSKDMDTHTDINYMFDEPRYCEQGDKIDVAFDNTDGNLWGIRLFTRRLV